MYPEFHHYVTLTVPLIILRNEDGEKEALTILQIYNRQLENMFSQIQDAWYHPYEFLNPVIMANKLGLYTTKTKLQTQDNHEGQRRLRESNLNLRHKNNTRILSVGIKFCTVCIQQSKNGSSKLNNSNLHSQTYAKERNPVFTGIFGSKYFTLHTSIAKSSGNQYSISPLSA